MFKQLGKMYDNLFGEDKLSEILETFQNEIENYLKENKGIVFIALVDMKKKKVAKMYTNSTFDYVPVALAWSDLFRRDAKVLTDIAPNNTIENTVTSTQNEMHFFYPLGHDDMAMYVVSDKVHSNLVLSRSKIVSIINIIAARESA